MIEMKDEKIKPKRKRELGWDLWRFIGSFLIFLGHNGLAFELSQYYNREEMLPKSFFGVLTSPIDVVQFLLYTCVPVFLFISGYFILGRPTDPEKDWDKAKSGFWKYIKHYWKWLTVSAVIIIALALTQGPNAVAGMFMQESMTWSELIMAIAKNYVNMSLLDFGATMMVALNWFFVIMAWLMLFTPIFKYFIQTKHIKMVRTITLVILLFSTGFPTINYIFEHVATFSDNIFVEFLATLSPVFTGEAIGFNIANSFIPMYMLGGLFAVDTETHERIKNWSWPKALGIILLLFIMQIGIQYYGDMIPSVDGANLSYYVHAGWIPMAIGWIILAVKWNEIIDEDSRLGRFILNWSPDTLGVMTLAWFAGPYILSGVFIPVFDAMILSLWNPASPIIFTTVMLLFYLVYFIVIFVLVHLLKKVPYVRRLFMI